MRSHKLSPSRFIMTKAFFVTVFFLGYLMIGETKAYPNVLAKRNSEPINLSADGVLECPHCTDMQVFERLTGINPEAVFAPPCTESDPSKYPKIFCSTCLIVEYIVDGTYVHMHRGCNEQIQNTTAGQKVSPFVDDVFDPREAYKVSRWDSNHDDWIFTVYRMKNGHPKTFCQETPGEFICGDVQSAPAVPPMADPFADDVSEDSYEVIDPCGAELDPNEFLLSSC
ncbi:unnamed protein product [Caenorhabditis auriculariae]|uniref:Uncharacterized protein n=1 Tax=Caenorhabditis auriculariae TaxID=2777116 RepID=A0A8S1HIR9_9PELO|nr:unnamed protein product [Caenorhabditis auriculariae]